MTSASWRGRARQRTLPRFRQASISTMRRWKACWERLSSRAARLLNRQRLSRLSQDAGDGFDGCSSLDRRRAGNIGNQGFPVFSWNLEMWVGFDEWLVFHSCCTGSRVQFYIKAEALAISKWALSMCWRPRTSLIPPFRLCCRGGGKRIFRPMVLGIAAAEIFANFLIRRGPEASQVLRDLDRSFGRRE